VFLAPHSVLAFAVPISIVVTVSRAARTIFRTDSESLVVPWVTALVLGMAIAAITIADRRNRPRTAGQWAMTLIIVLLNTFVLLAAALGIEKF
jgi:hypothetical protein